MKFVDQKSPDDVAFAEWTKQELACVIHIDDVPSVNEEVLCTQGRR